MSTEMDGVGIPQSSGRKKLDRVSDAMCPPGELVRLEGSDATIDRMIARHRNAKPVLLRKLAISPDAITQQGVATNPNTPLKTLLSLAGKFPREFILNPAFDLMVLENPSVLAKLDPKLLGRVLEKPECPASILHWAAVRWSTEVKPDLDIMRAIARNSATPSHTLEYMLSLDQIENITGSEGWL